VISRFVYPANFTRDSAGRTLVKFRDLPGAATGGASPSETMEEAIDCLGSYLAARLAEKAEVPAPSRPKTGQRLVPVPLWLAPN